MTNAIIQNWAIPSFLHDDAISGQQFPPLRDLSLFWGVIHQMGIARGITTLQSPVPVSMAKFNGNEGGSAFQQNAMQVAHVPAASRWIIPIEVNNDPQETLQLEIKRLEFDTGMRGWCNLRVYRYRDIVTAVISDVFDQEGNAANPCQLAINAIVPVSNIAAQIAKGICAYDFDYVLHYMPPRPNSTMTGDDFAMVEFEHTVVGKNPFTANEYENYKFHTALRGWVESTIGGTFDPIELPALLDSLC